MGWGRTLLLGDIGNRLDIEDVENDLENLRWELSRSEESNRDLESQLLSLRKDNAELKLYVASLLRVLVSKEVLTREELAKMVDVVDSEDGSKDGGHKGDIV